MRSRVFNGLILMVSLSNHGQHHFFSILLDRVPKTALAILPAIAHAVNPRGIVFAILVCKEVTRTREAAGP